MEVRACSLLSSKSDIKALLASGITDIWRQIKTFNLNQVNRLNYISRINYVKLD
jgi:hypothetical protein